MKTAFHVAELLEEIARKADPFSVVKRAIHRLLGNVRIPNVTYMFQPDPQKRTYTITYLIPVNVAMRGVEGTPAEVIEWLNTGTSPDVSVSIQNFNRPYFAVKQVHRNEHVIADLKELWGNFEKRLFPADEKRDK